jgi:undecaprenyl diphosphate synthase
MEIKHGLQAAVHAGPTGFSKGLYTRDEPPVDLLVRTSGTSRLSDFMLWQCSVDTELMFVNYYWPEFDTWRLILVILQWRVSTTRPQIAGLVVAGLLRPLLALRN